MTVSEAPSGYGPGSGLVHGFLYNLCSALCSCFYVFSCCWLIEDCFAGRRYGPPRPPFGLPDLGPPPPPPPPPIGPRPAGIMGSHFGPSGPISQPGPIGYPGDEPPRF